MTIALVVSGLLAATAPASTTTSMLAWTPPTPAVAASTCGALTNAENAAAFAQLPDAPTTINSARIVPAGGTHGLADDDLPEICRVEGYIAPTVGFLLRMPSRDWNGKFMMGGCGAGCRYGVGGAEVDWMTYLENWVEKGEAPDQVITHHMVKEPYPAVNRSITDYGSPMLRTVRFPLKPEDYDRSRPIFAYPDIAQWSGNGDPNKPEGWIKTPR